MSDELVSTQLSKGTPSKRDSIDPIINNIPEAQIRDRIDGILSTLLSGGELDDPQDLTTMETLARFPILTELSKAYKLGEIEAKTISEQSKAFSQLVLLATSQKNSKDIINALNYSTLETLPSGLVQLNGEFIRFGNSNGPILNTQDVQVINDLFINNPTAPETLRRLCASSELLFDKELSPSIVTLQEVLRNSIDGSKDGLSSREFLLLAEEVKKGSVDTVYLSTENTITYSGKQVPKATFDSYKTCFEFLRARGLLDYLIEFLKLLRGGSFLPLSNRDKVVSYDELKSCLLTTTDVIIDSSEYYPEIFEVALLPRTIYNVEFSEKPAVSTVLRRLAVSIRNLKLQKFIQDGIAQGSLNEQGLLRLIKGNIDLRNLQDPFLINEWEFLLQGSTDLLLSQGLRINPTINFFKNVRNEEQPERERVLIGFKPLENEFRVLEYRDELNKYKKLILERLLSFIRVGVLNSENGIASGIDENRLQNDANRLKLKYRDLQIDLTLNREFVEPLKRLISPAFELAFYKDVEQVREDFGKSDTGTGSVFFRAGGSSTLIKFDLLRGRARGNKKLLKMVDDLEKSYKEYLFAEKPKETFRYIRQQFQDSLYPLVFFLRSDPSKREKLEKYISLYKDSAGEVNPNLVYRLYLREFLSQRSLTAEEVQYLRSVEVPSVLNPYLVAAMACFPDETSAFLKNHFREVSKNIAENIQDGDYFPTLVVGLGVSGAVTAGEIARLNPSIASSVLYVDSKDLPGGPFEVGGRSWRLNSSNATRTRRGGRVLPPSDQNFYRIPGPTVRSKAPLSWYPGERSVEDEDYSSTRVGDINPVVPYLPELSEISEGQRYATNDSLALLIQSHVAMCAKNVLLETKVLNIERSNDQSAKGTKIVTLEIRQGEETKIVKISTDSLIIGTGLGVPNYGFDIEKSDVYKLTKPTKDKPFPRITTVLEAFRLFNELKEKGSNLRGRIAICGKGNSADILIEYLGRIFESGNSLTNEIKKIYVIGEGSLSKRPRYNNISDILPRENPNRGDQNLVQVIDDRVLGIQEIGEGGPLLLRGKNGFIIDSSDDEIEVDYIISAAGFRPDLEPLLAGYSSQFAKTNNDEVLRPLYTPLYLDNTSLKVGDSLRNDPTVLVVGTASAPDFGEEKLQQLPPLSRDALERVGVTNAVAIGFRTPETLAAVQQWMETYGRSLSNAETSITSRRKQVKINGEIESRIFNTKINISEEAYSSLGTEDVPIMLTSIFEYTLGNSVRFFSIESDGDIKYFDGSLKFILSYKKENRYFEFKYLECSGSEAVASTLCKEVVNTLKNPNVQKYLLKSFEGMRTQRGINVDLFFLKGYPDPKRTEIY